MESCDEIVEVPGQRDLGVDRPLRGHEVADRVQAVPADLLRDLAVEGERAGVGELAGGGRLVVEPEGADRLAGVEPLGVALQAHEAADRVGGDHDRGGRRADHRPAIEEAADVRVRDELAEDGAGAHVRVEGRMHLGEGGALGGGERRTERSVRVQLAALELRIGDGGLRVMADRAADRGDLRRRQKAEEQLWRGR